MVKFGAAFILGVVVTIGVFLVLKGPEKLGNSSSSIAQSKQEAPIDQHSSNVLRRTEAKSDTGGNLSSIGSSTVAESTSSTQPGYPAPTSSETVGPIPESAPTARNGVSAPVRNYTPPNEISTILEDKVPDELHEQYEAESKEESWSNYMESQIAAYFASKAALLTFDIALIDCRTSICEIHAVGYGPKAYAVWTNEIADITEQNWFEFTGMSGSASNAAPDIIGIVVVLHKNNS